jgi:hypothetical protein
VDTSPPSHAVEYAGFVLLHCAVIADGNRDGELICPFAMLRDTDSTRVLNFESDTQHEAVEKGWSSLAESKKRDEWWAFGREGLARTATGAVDVLLVSVWVPGMEEPATISQSFARADDGSLYLTDEPDLVVGARDGAEHVSRWDRLALVRGIESHAEGGRWAEWRRQ